MAKAPKPFKADKPAEIESIPGIEPTPEPTNTEAVPLPPLPKGVDPSMIAVSPDDLAVIRKCIADAPVGAVVMCRDDECRKAANAEMEAAGKFFPTKTRERQDAAALWRVRV